MKNILLHTTFLFLKWHLFLLTLVGCALPVSEENLQSFVPQVDLQVVSLTREGLDYFTRSRFVDAEFRFLEALQLTPEIESINFNLALTLIEEGEYSKAKGLLKYILKKDPTSTKIMAALARLYISKNDYNNAIEYYKKALNVAFVWQEFPRAASFSRSISVLYFLLGREVDALEYSGLALSLASNAEEMCKHGKLLIATGKYKEAGDKTLAFINNREVKRDPCLTANLALVAFADNDFSDVIRYCEMVLNFRKTDLETSNLVKLLQFFAEKKIKEQRGENKEVDALLQEKIEEEVNSDDSPLLSYQDGEPLVTNFALYWPANLLELLKEAANERLVQEE